MIDLFLSLSTESKMIAVLAVMFVVSVAWSNKDKIKALIPKKNKSVDGKPGPHDLLDSYLMLVKKAEDDGDDVACENLQKSCHIVFKPYAEEVK